MRVTVTTPQLPLLEPKYPLSRTMRPLLRGTWRVMAMNLRMTMVVIPKAACTHIVHI